MDFSSPRTSFCHGTGVEHWAVSTLGNSSATEIDTQDQPFNNTKKSSLYWLEKLKKPQIPPLLWAVQEVWMFFVTHLYKTPAGIKHGLKNCLKRPGAVTQQLTALAAFPEGLGSIPGTYIVAHNHL